MVPAVSQEEEDLLARRVALREAASTPLLRLLRLPCRLRPAPLPLLLRRLRWLSSRGSSSVQAVLDPQPRLAALLARHALGATVQVGHGGRPGARPERLLAREGEDACSGAPPQCSQAPRSRQPPPCSPLSRSPPPMPPRSRPPPALVAALVLALHLQHHRRV
jgi:hypothetical protein